MVAAAIERSHATIPVTAGRALANVGPMIARLFAGLSPGRWVVAWFAVCSFAASEWPTAVAAEVHEPAAGFLSARPVWASGEETTRNLTLGFRATFPMPAQGRVIVRLTASTLYRLHVNGRFVGHGPARAGQGFYRVDEWELGRELVAGTNVVAIEVAGYNANSYYLLDQPSFLQAEVTVGDRVLASTGGAGTPFVARRVTERVQKVQRYSFQRPFSEVWRLGPGWDAWRMPDWTGDSTVSVPLTVRPAVALLPRRVPYPEFALRPPVALVGSGVMAAGAAPAKPWRDRALTDIGPKLGGFPEGELATIPSLEFQAWRNTAKELRTEGWVPGTPVDLRDGQFRIADFGVNLTGFLGLEVVARSRARVFVAFDEILRDGDVDWMRLGCVNLVVLELEPGRYAFESFEPYTLRYAKIVAVAGEVSVGRLALRELANPDVTEARFACSDPRLNRLFAAGRETFRQNAVDVFMDCPSRERAGWLCDSFFTARVAPRLGGDCVVERNFLENFLLPARFPHLPEGMLPMCYPADHHDGVFIPNWAMWFVVELEEYAARSGDRALVEALRPKVLRLLEFLRGLRNEDGLLERLPNWVFVEWSKANEWVQDVNFPSNMLYARVLEVAGRLYGMPELRAEADRVRGTIRRLSFDGAFFVDNAVRREGKLAVTRNRSEVCQYFAFFFDVATPESHPELWRVLRDEFGPQRKQTRAHPEIAAANAFVGNQLRLEILSRYGRCQQTLDESVGYLLYMADRTGTLWENDGDYASCNHGFASHIVHVLDRDVLGLYEVDTVHRVVRLRFTDVRLDWCEGAVPTPDGPVELNWWKDTSGGGYRYRLAMPEGYRLEVAAPPEPKWERAY